MRLGRYVLVSLVAVSMTSSPVLAQAATGSSSVAARSGAGMESAERLGGRGLLSEGGFIIPLIVVLAVALGFLVSGSEDTAPVSP